jgi:hypothetical protein
MRMAEITHDAPFRGSGMHDCGKRPKTACLPARLRIVPACLQHLTEPRPRGSGPSEPFFRGLLVRAAAYECFGIPDRKPHPRAYASLNQESVAACA